MTLTELIAQVCNLPDGYYVADKLGPIVPPIDLTEYTLSLQRATEVAASMSSLFGDHFRVVHIVDGEENA